METVRDALGIFTEKIIGKPQRESFSQIELVFVRHGDVIFAVMVENGKTEKYMGCVHPWMRMTINPKGRAERALANP